MTSCRNRHCPKCQGRTRATWLAAEQALLLPIPYCHVVFTLPHQLHPLIRVNHRRLYDLPFQTAAQTLQEFARDPQPPGADIGITAVLHTWGQTLTEHAHVHYVVTDGGLSPDGTQWRARRHRFLFAVKALGAVFRGKYLAGLERLRRPQRLASAGESTALAEEEVGDSLRQQLYAKPWVVYAKPPWGSPAQVLKYLSRYTHRVAIANSRLVFVGNGVVRFRYTDYATGGTAKVMELRAEELLRCFLLHVVPTGFVRIRHYGLLANRTRQAKLARARQFLAIGAATPLLSPVSATNMASSPTAAARAAPSVLARPGASSPGACHNEGIPPDLSPERFSMVAPTIFTARACPHGANDPRVSPSFYKGLSAFPVVYPLLCPPFVSPPAWGHIQPPCLPPAFVYLRLYLFARMLTGSVTIGRVRQTR